MKLNDAINQENDHGAKAIGLLIQELAALDARILPLVEQDLDNKNMSLAACYDALRKYAEKHKQGGSWACPVLGIDPDNEVIKVVMEFYKISPEWITTAGADRDTMCAKRTLLPEWVKPALANPAKSQAVGHGSDDDFDLLGLL